MSAEIGQIEQLLDSRFEVFVERLSSKINEAEMRREHGDNTLSTAHASLREELRELRLSAARLSAEHEVMRERSDRQVHSMRTEIQSLIDDTASRWGERTEKVDETLKAHGKEVEERLSALEEWRTTVRAGIAGAAAAGSLAGGGLVAVLSQVFGFGG